MKYANVVQTQSSEEVQMSLSDVSRGTSKSAPSEYFLTIVHVDIVYTTDGSSVSALHVPDTTKHGYGNDGSHPIGEPRARFSRGLHVRPGAGTSWASTRKLFRRRRCSSLARSSFSRSVSRHPF